MRSIPIVFLIFLAPIFAEKIHIISYQNGVGLSQDIEILQEELTKLGHIVKCIDYRDQKPVAKVDINLFVEVVNDYYFAFADKNYLLPNPEWYVFPSEWIRKMDKILCKTKEGVRIFKEYNSNTVFMSFTSRDRLDPTVKKDYKEALHLVGASIQKSTPTVIDTWLMDKRLPHLSIIKHTGASNMPQTDNLKLLYNYYPYPELKQLQNRCGLHICPSVTEGFGHYIVEAMSCEAVVVTTNGPPMNEMITDPKCLIDYEKTFSWRLATCFLPDSNSLKEVVFRLMNYSEEELKEIGRKNRKWYLANDRYFKKQVAEIFKPSNESWLLTHFVWNLGLAATGQGGLDGNPLVYFSDPKFPIVLDGLKKGDILWTKCSLIPAFYKEVLPKLPVPIILMISDGDESFPSSCADSIDIKKLIQDDKILHIFAQNCDYKGTDGKVTPIPIGIDFHTMAFKKGARPSWGEMKPVLEQEAILQRILSSLKPTGERKCRAFVDFQHIDSMRYGNNKRYLEFHEDRTSIFHKLLATNLIDYSKEMTTREELWKKKGEYAFSISPPGNGYDCHRTWEDLALGCIVIVKSTPIDPLFEGLPVILVKDWDEVTEENMKKWLKQYGDAFSNPFYREKLTNRYWLNKMKSLASLALL